MGDPRAVHLHRLVEPTRMDWQSIHGAARCDVRIGVQRDPVHRLPLLYTVWQLDVYAVSPAGDPVDAAPRRLDAVRVGAPPRIARGTGRGAHRRRPDRVLV